MTGSFPTLIASLSIDSIGRSISADLTVRTYERIPKSIEILSPLVDYFCTIWNDKVPVLIASSSSSVVDDSSFFEFSQIWSQELKLGPGNR
jgi:hypothetical protein